MFCIFAEFEWCKINSINITGISGNFQAIAEKFIGDQDGGHGVEPPVKACKKLAQVESGIKVCPGQVSLIQWKSCLFFMFCLFPDFEHFQKTYHLNLIMQLLGISGNARFPEMPDFLKSLRQLY